MSKLIPMEEAAKVLGLSVEKLNELRSNNEVFGYRDGSTWKFKMSELERVADDLGLSISPLSSAIDGIKDVFGLGDDESDSSVLDLGLEESSDDLFIESDSIAMDDSSVELFQSAMSGADGGTSSDILADDDDDMIDLADSGLLVKSSSKDMLLDQNDDDDDLSLFDSSDDLNLDEALDEAADDLMPKDSSLDVKLEDSSFDLNLEDSSDDLKLEDSSLGLKLGDSPDDLNLEDSSLDLNLGDSSDDLKLEDSSLGLKSGGSSDDLKLEDSSLDLNLEDSSDDLKLDASSADLALEESSDDLKLEDSGLVLKTDGDDSVKLSDDSVLDGDDELSFGSSSLELASEAQKSDSPSSTGDDLFSEESTSGAPSTGKLLAGGSDDDDDLSLNVEDDLFDDDLDLADSASFESSEISSNFEDSGDLVLDSDSSGELTLEANESGIALSANESGIALGDEPLELGGSDIDELELPEDDEIVLVDDLADSDSATLMQEDDFNLTPHEMSLDDDDSSGSQVIALAESEIYADDSAATVLGSSESFDDHSFDGGGFDPTAAGMVGVGVVGAAGAAAAGTGRGIAADEVTYSKWQIGGLVLTASALFLGSIVAYGTAQNLWLPDDEVVSSGLMKLFIDSLGMN